VKGRKAFPQPESQGAGYGLRERETCYQDLIRPMQTGAIDKKCASKGIKILMEALYGHLPETLFHHILQKVRGLAVEFT
jgi:hypothetical protein